MTEFRKGFYLGDGAGVGKGRQVAGLLLENVKARGLTKHVWISASADLIIDAKRDLEDLGITDELLACVSIKDIGYEKKNWNKLGGNVIIFATYASLTNRSTKLNVTRYDRLVDFLGKDFQGLLIFDEGHKSKNLVFKDSKLSSAVELAGTKCGQAVYRLQDQIPKARCLYCSATGVTTIENFGYMTRLALWADDSKFANGFLQFKEKVESGGIGMHEILSSYMKQKGLYNARSLSFSGCEFFTVVDSVPAFLLNKYDACCSIFTTILKSIKDGIRNGTIVYPRKTANRHASESVNFEDDDDYEDSPDY